MIIPSAIYIQLSSWIDLVTLMLLFIAAWTWLQGCLFLVTINLQRGDYSGLF